MISTMTRRRRSSCVPTDAGPAELSASEAAASDREATLLAEVEESKIAAKRSSEAASAKAEAELLATKQAVMDREAALLAELKESKIAAKRGSEAAAAKAEAELLATKRAVMVWARQEKQAAVEAARQEAEQRGVVLAESAHASTLAKAKEELVVLKTAHAAALSACEAAAQEREGALHDELEGSRERASAELAATKRALLLEAEHDKETAVEAAKKEAEKRGRVLADLAREDAAAIMRAELKETMKLWTPRADPTRTPDRKHEPELGAMLASPSATVRSGELHRMLSSPSVSVRYTALQALSADPYMLRANGAQAKDSIGDRHSDMRLLAAGRVVREAGSPTVGGSSPYSAPGSARHGASRSLSFSRLDES